MWGMTGDQMYDLIDGAVFAVFLLLAMLIYGLVWRRHDPCDCACACADDDGDEENDVEADLPKTPGSVVGLPVPGTKRNE